MFLSAARSILSCRLVYLHLRYGFGIGMLYYKMSNALQPLDTGLYVVCDDYYKSIWVAFDSEPCGETGDIEGVVLEYSDP